MYLENFDKPQRLIVGISGASGVIYGIRLLELLKDSPIETHLIITDSAVVTLAHETDHKLEYVKSLASACYSNKDIGSSISSGSFKTMGMVVAPCSIRSMSEVATGTTSSLLARAADVVLKERRRLVLMVRETPLHTNHLRNMTALSEAGAIIAPPVPAFYIKPKTLNDIVNHSLGRILDLFDVDLGIVDRWKER